MSKKRASINPFYPLVVLFGVMFAITACAFGVMAIKAIHPQSVADGAGAHPLMAYLDRHGMATMVVELALLGLVSFLAMGTDRYWTGERPGALEEPTPTEPKLDS